MFEESIINLYLFYILFFNLIYITTNTCKKLLWFNKLPLGEIISSVARLGCKEVLKISTSNRGEGACYKIKSNLREGKTS